MLSRLKSWLLAGLTVLLLAAGAAAQDDDAVPRLALDWEPDPNRPSIAVIVFDCKDFRIVELIGGTEIRRRALRAK